MAKDINPLQKKCAYCKKKIVRRDPHENEITILGAIITWRGICCRECSAKLDEDGIEV